MKTVGLFSLDSVPQGFIENIRSAGKSEGGYTLEIVWTTTCFKRHGQLMPSSLLWYSGGYRAIVTPAD